MRTILISYTHGANKKFNFESGEESKNRLQNFYKMMSTNSESLRRAPLLRSSDTTHFFKPTNQPTKTRKAKPGQHSVCSYGNMTSDGTNSYSWDAENRMIKITYPGVNNYSTFGYDGYHRNILIVETTAGSVTSTKQFVWSSDDRREERDGLGTLTKKFFDWGQINSATKYFYDLDHLGCVRELSDNSSVIQAQYAFDLYGRMTKISENVASDFGYAKYYQHTPSKLSLTRTRSYSSVLSRFLSRDPIAESSGSNLFSYVGNNPVLFVDPTGTSLTIFNPLCIWFPWLCVPPPGPSPTPTPTPKPPCKKDGDDDDPPPPPEDGDGDGGGGDGGGGDPPKTPSKRKTGSGGGGGDPTRKFKKRRTYRTVKRKQARKDALFNLFNGRIEDSQWSTFLDIWSRSLEDPTKLIEWLDKNRYIWKSDPRFWEPGPGEL